MCFGLYADTLAAAINLFKFQGIRRLYRPLGDFLAEFDVSEFDALVPVPLSLSRLRDRGFNLSLLLAKFLSTKTGIPLIIDGLTKRNDTPPQPGLSAKDRTANLKGAFRAELKFSGMKLLLIDDVMTTGATAHEYSKELLRAGAQEVVVLTLARASNN